MAVSGRPETLRNWVRAAGASRPRLQRCGWLRRPPSPPNASLTTSPRAVFLPAFLHFEVKRHLDWYAEKEPDGLLSVGERGAPFRRSTFGRKWRRARTKVGLPEGFRF